MRRFIRHLGLLCGSSSGVIPVVAVIILAIAAVGVVGTASIVQQSNLDDRGLAFVTGNQYGSGGVSKTTSTGNVKTSTPKPVTGNSAAQNPNSNPGSVPNPGAKADTQNSGKNGSVTPATGNSGSNNNNNNSNNSNSDKAKKDSKSSGSGGSGTVTKVEPKEFAGTGPVGKPIGNSVIPGYSQTIKQQQSATQGRPQQTPVAPAPGAQAGQQQGTGNPNGSGGSAGTTGTTQNFQQGTQPANQTSLGTAPAKGSETSYAPGAGVVVTPQKPSNLGLPAEGTATDPNLVLDLKNDAKPGSGTAGSAVPPGSIIVSATPKPPDYVPPPIQKPADVPQKTFDSQLVRCCVPTSSGGEYCYNTNRASCQARSEARESGIAQLQSQPRPVDTAPVPLPTVFRELERKPVGGTCTSGSECGSGQCNAGRCVAKEGASCSASNQCATGSCLAGKCTVPNFLPTGNPSLPLAVSQQAAQVNSTEGAFRTDPQTGREQVLICVSAACYWKDTESSFQTDALITFQQNPEDIPFGAYELYASQIQQSGVNLADLEEAYGLGGNALRSLWNSLPQSLRTQIATQATAELGTQEQLAGYVFSNQNFLTEAGQQAATAAVTDLNDFLPQTELDAYTQQIQDCYDAFGGRSGCQGVLYGGTIAAGAGTVAAPAITSALSGFNIGSSVAATYGTVTSAATYTGVQVLNNPAVQRFVQQLQTCNSDPACNLLLNLIDDTGITNSVQVLPVATGAVTNNVVFTSVGNDTNQVSNNRLTLGGVFDDPDSTAIESEFLGYFVENTSGYLGQELQVVTSLREAAALVSGPGDHLFISSHGFENGTVKIGGQFYTGEQIADELIAGGLPSGCSVTWLVCHAGSSGVAMSASREFVKQGVMDVKNTAATNVVSIFENGEVGVTRDLFDDAGKPIYSEEIGGNAYEVLPDHEAWVTIINGWFAQ